MIDVNSEMKANLKEIEETCGVRILLAVEPGSRTGEMPCGTVIMMYGLSTQF